MSAQPSSSQRSHNTQTGGGFANSSPVRQAAAQEVVEYYDDTTEAAGAPPAQGKSLLKSNQKSSSVRDERLAPIPLETYDDGFVGESAGDCCGGPTCGGCTSCQPCGLPCIPICDRLWVRGEYLLWWTSGNPLPPLVTTSPNNTGRDAAGVLGQPGTQILFGSDDLDSGSRSGGRITLGYWLDPCHCWGLEVDYLGLEDESADFVAQSGGLPILARPFFNVQDNQQDAELVAFPNVLSGRVAAAGSGQFESLEILARRMLYQDCCARMDLLVGYRWARLDDQLRVVENLTTLGTSTGIEPGTTIDLFDQFNTKNDFHGAVLGVSGQWRRNNLTLELLMKLGLGNTRSQVLIDGGTTSVTPSGMTATHSGGLLAQDTNIGVYENNEFAVLPELGVKLHYDFCCRWRASIGYNFLYWSSVMRSGEQIDFGVNVSQLPPGPLTGSPQPRYLGTTSDFWAQGLSFGLEYRF
ncbi:MAG: BBP7 family outer membrane beta-barrel protein [Pirellulaceae bacterium]|nr:BBP7 family outer membrane beta-barrel protein [Pirellulaceae bacterium]